MAQVGYGYGTVRRSQDYQEPIDQGPNDPSSTWENSPQINFNPSTESSPSSPLNNQSENWSQGPWDANRVRRYFQSRGVTPNDSSPDYWAARWNEWGQRDPEYFLRRLAAADELVGGPQNSPFQENAGGSGSVTAPATSGFTNEIRHLLMGQINSLSQPVDPNDPTIQASLAASRLEGTRSNEQARRMLAERLYQSSGSNVIDKGALDQGVQQAQERSATNTANLGAQLMQRELLSRREQLQQYLGMALQSGETETARQIQMALANLNAQLQREGYGITLAGMQNNQNNNTTQAVV